MNDSKKIKTIVNLALMIIVCTAFVAVVCASVYLLGWIFKRGKKLRKPQIISNGSDQVLPANDIFVDIPLDLPPSYNEATKNSTTGCPNKF